MSESSQEAEAESDAAPEVLSGELRIYDTNGVPLGGLSGYTVKRATRAALLSAVEGVDDLLYQVAWRDSVLPPGIEGADFFPSAGEVAAGSQLFPSYLSDAGVDPQAGTRCWPTWNAGRGRARSRRSRTWAGGESRAKQ